MALNIVWDGDCDGKSQNRMGYAERVNVAITSEDLAGKAARNQAGHQQYRIGNVREAEESCAEQNRAASRNQLLETQEEIRLQNELLQHSPDRVTSGVPCLGDSAE